MKVIRADRFCERALHSLLEDGYILKWLKRLKAIGRGLRMVITPIKEGGEEMSGKHKYTQSFIAAIIGLAILILVARTHQELEYYLKKYIVIDKRFFVLYYTALVLFILFGVLIEWRRLLNLFKRRGGVNKPLLLLSLALIISVIPSPYYMTLLGGPGFHSPAGILVLLFSLSWTRNTISLLAGILLIRSLSAGYMEQSSAGI